MEADERDDGGGGSGRCTCCSFMFALCKIACFTCWRRYICVCCCAPPHAPRPEIPVLCLGVGPAGKSTLLATLSGESTDDIQPTNGSESIQPYWSRYFSGHQAVIYVVDSTASDEQLSKSSAALQKCLGDPALSGRPLLLLFHRHDMGGAKPLDELTKKMQLDSMSDGRTCIVKATSIHDVATLRSSFEQLVDCLLDD